MRRLSMPLLLIVLLSLPLVVCAQVYKWKDAHGTVHYSDTPPPHGVNYSSVKTAARMVAAGNAAPHDKSGDAGDTSTEDAQARAPQQPMTDTPDNRKKLCTNLQANIKLLKGSSPVITTDANGKQQIMSKEHRGSELDKEQKQYQQFCG